jgi:hypothetical protein
MDTFKDINKNLVYINANSKSEAISFRDEAKAKSLEGKSVVIFFENRYHLYLAPGQDPYQVRKDIDAFVNRQESEPKDESNTKNTPARDSSGKFVSKK